MRVRTLLCHEVQHVPEDGAALHAPLDSKAPAEGEQNGCCLRHTAASAVACSGCEATSEDVTEWAPPDTTTGQPHSPLNRYSVHLLWGSQGGGARRVGRSHAGEDANHKMAAGITVSTAALVDQCQHVLQAVRDGHALRVGAGKPPGGEAEGAHAP